MAIPDFQSMMRPVLDAHADGGPHAAAEVRDQVAAALGVTEDDRKVMLPSGGQPLFSNRVAWAVTHLAQAALLERREKRPEENGPGDHEAQVFGDVDPLVRQGGIVEKRQVPDPQGSDAQQPGHGRP